MLKAVWLASDQLCSKLLQISPAQIDRLRWPARVQHPKKRISATRPGTLLRHAVPTRGGTPDTSRPGSVEADTVAHCDDITEGDHVHSLTLIELYSGWTENRAVWNKSADSVLVRLKELEAQIPYEMKDFHTDNGGEFLNWALYRHLTGRASRVPWTHAARIARTTTRIASRRTGRRCASSSGTNASGIPSWCR